MHRHQRFPGVRSADRAVGVTAVTPIRARCPDRARRSIGLGGAIVLAGAAGTHIYWLCGGRAGRTKVIPTVHGRPTFRPGPVATAGVALALTAAAVLYAGASLGSRPRWLHRAGALSAATVLGARAIGDGRRVGFLKTERGSAFARLDTALLSPLCAGLACAGVAAAMSRQRPRGVPIRPSLV